MLFVHYRGKHYPSHVRSYLWRFAIETHWLCVVHCYFYIFAASEWDRTLVKYGHMSEVLPWTIVTEYGVMLFVYYFTEVNSTLLMCSRMFEALLLSLSGCEWCNVTFTLQQLHSETVHWSIMFIFQKFCHWASVIQYGVILFVHSSSYRVKQYPCHVRSYVRSFAIES